MSRKVTDKPASGDCPRCGLPLVNRKAAHGRRHTRGSAPDFLIHEHSFLVSCDDRINHHQKEISK